MRLKRLQFDVVVKTCHDWINALLVKKKWTEVEAMSGVANPSPAPVLTAFNNFDALNWKNWKKIACVNALILKALILIYLKMQ